MKPVPCIEILDHAGERTGVETVAELIDLTIQDDEVGARIVRDLAESGSYEFAGDGEDPETDQTFRVIDQDAFTAQAEAVLDPLCVCGHRHSRHQADRSRQFIAYPCTDDACRWGECDDFEQAE
jgi:hypothetical protein